MGQGVKPRPLHQLSSSPQCDQDRAASSRGYSLVHVPH